MDDKLICRKLRKVFNQPALALLVYFIMMNVLVSVVAFVEVFILMLTGETNSQDAALDQVIQNGLGYLLATAMGAIALLLWKKRQFCFHEIWKKSKSMTIGSFCAILLVFVSAQALFQVIAAAMEWLFQLFDMSVLKSLEMASFTADSISMFLYVALLAPVFEEILFRGLVLRTFLPYGRKFAIFASAFLFGIFHGNPVQSPYAFAVGLILGYVTVEYSLVWAVVLHTINNFVLGDALTRLMQILPDWIGELIWFLIIWGSAVASLVLLLVNRRKVAEYLGNGKIHPFCIKSFFSTPGVLILIGVMTVNMLLMLML